MISTQRSMLNLRRCLPSMIFADGAGLKPNLEKPPESPKADRYISFGTTYFNNPLPSLHIWHLGPHRMYPVDRSCAAPESAMRRHCFITAFVPILWMTCSNTDNVQVEITTSVYLLSNISSIVKHPPNQKQRSYQVAQSIPYSVIFQTTGCSC